MVAEVARFENATALETDSTWFIGDMYRIGFTIESILIQDYWVNGNVCSYLRYQGAYIHT